ncbi:MAG: hypothetical protein GEU83_13730 [Pseudonocardiaceae bacterium]|nr:hypothetical protein [Pseudonocardiaceae bacterium]
MPRRSPTDAGPRLLRRERFTDAEPPELDVDIQVLHGAEGEQLARRQVRVLWEVTQWLAHDNSPTGQQRAA